MTSFNVGDKVHVEFDAVVTENGTSGRDRMFTQTLKEVTDKPGYVGTVHYVYLHEDNATVVEAEPASWPPQIGDVWEANGDEYFVYNAIFGGATVFPFAGTSPLEFYSNDSYSDNSLDDFKALKPKLVRRRSTSNIGSFVSEALKAYGGRIA